VLWVKGSGGDIGTLIKLDGFSTLYMDKLQRPERPLPRPAARRRDGGLLPHCTFNLNPRAASIDTPLHACMPQARRPHAPRTR
jgi:rhamnose utilization protein RhaD (predicted bifunctional aldolase and dehydrogenase)